MRNLKRAFSRSLAFILVMILVIPCTFAAEDDPFIIENGVLVSYVGYGGIVTIPDGVTEIGEEAFCRYGAIHPLLNDVPLTRVIIPEGVTKIGEQAFAGSSTGIAIWDTVHLQVTLPSTLKEIGKEAFSSCGITQISLPDGLEVIGEGAFQFNDELTDIRLPSSVKEIGASAFSGCNLSKVTIPSGTQLGKDAFDHNPFLETVTFADNRSMTDAQRAAAFGRTIWYYRNQSNSQSEKYQFEYNGSAFYSNGDIGIMGDTTYLKKCTTLKGTVVVPEGVVRIGTGGLSNQVFNSGVEQIILPSTLQTIASFGGSSRELDIPNSVTSITTALGNPYLERITLPDNLTVIFENFLEGSVSLKEVKLPKNLQEIKQGAFWKCKSLTHIDLPEGLKIIGDYAFQESGLTSVVLPNSLEDLSMTAFNTCPNLTSITLPTKGRVAEDMKVWPSRTFGTLFMNNPLLTEVKNIQNAEFLDNLERSKAILASLKNPRDYVGPQSEKVTTLSNQIVQGATSDLEKARSIYGWVTSRIQYDHDYSEGRKSTVIIDPEGVIDSKLTVCEGYTRLTAALLQAQGIPACYVTGDADNGKNNTWESHAWNAVYIDGKWIWVDSTWGASTAFNIYQGFDIPIYYLSSDHRADKIVALTASTTPTQPAPSTPTPSTPATGAVLSSQKLTVDGKEIDCEKYNIGGSNYFKLRDLAQLLNGTGSQFGVGYDNATSTVTITTGEAYTPTGTEMATGVDNSSTAKPSSQTIKINGVEHGELTVYNIGGSNFFQLRELGNVLGFEVDYDGTTNTAIVRSIQK